MRYFFLLFLIIFPSIVWADANSNSSQLLIQEQNGTNAGRYRVLKVSNGTTTNNGDGSISVTTGAGGGGGGSTSPGGAQHDIQFYDVLGTVNTFGGNAGFVYISTGSTSGNVGIGSPNPGQLLDVQGTVRALAHSVFGATSSQFQKGDGSLDSSTYITGNQTITLSSDVTGSGTTAITTTLKNTGTVGTYRSTTFDAQGRETSGTNPTTFSGYAISDTSANLAAALTDETGTGVTVFGTAPTFTTSINLGAANLITDTTTGTKIGTATNQKLGFYNSAPAVQPTGNICTAMTSLGLISSCTESGGGSSQWTGTSPGPIYYATGNVGIGSTVPGQTLDVKGTTRLIGSLMITSTNNLFFGNDTLASIKASGNTGADIIINNNTLGCGGLGTGGVVTCSNGYEIHTFISSGTFTPANNGSNFVSVVSGGGAGGGNLGGGGGAGGALLDQAYSATASSPVTVTVGSGGIHGSSGGSTPTDATASSFNGITPVIGGYGGFNLSYNAENGGSGGGGGGQGSNTGGTGTLGQGNNGGSNANIGGTFPAAGGGGCGAVGQNTSANTAGSGGTGCVDSITSVTYAGGGGGAVNSGGVAGLGGNGGGGNGSTVTSGTGSSASINTGGGGGGGYTTGGDGGSGIVIVYIPQTISSETARFTTGGNVGVGSVTPGQKVDVSGTIRGQQLMDTAFGTTNLSPSGNTTKIVTTTGSLPTNDCGKWDASGNLVDSGGTCGGGGSASAAGGTNAVQYNSGSSTFAGAENLFSFNGSNVGINTTNGKNILDVEGTLNAVSFGGNVGIGSLVPTAALVVDGKSGLYPTNEDLVNIRGTTSLVANYLNVTSSTGTAISSINQFGNFTYNGGATAGGLVGTGVQAGTLRVATTGSTNNGLLLYPTTGSYTGNYLTTLQATTNNTLDVINSNGNLGMGTTTPLNFMDVRGTVNTFALNVTAAGNIGINSSNPGAALDVQGTTRFLSGNVGVGTFNPSRKFEVDDFSGANETAIFKTNTFNDINIQSGGSSPAYIVLNSAGAASGIIAERASPTGIGIHSADSNINNPDTAFFTSGNNMGIGITAPTAKLGILGNIGIGTLANSSFLSTVPPLGGMIIEGNVGIGSLSPGTLFDVNGSVGVRVLGTGTTVLFNGNVGIGTSTTTHTISMGSGGDATLAMVGSGTMKITNAAGSGTHDLSIIGSNNASGNLLLQDCAGTCSGTAIVFTSNNSGSPREDARFINNGNLGIGTTNPGQLVDVQGTIRIAKIGATISIVQGTNACAGTAILSTGTVTVSTTCTPSSANGFLITDLGGGVLANIGSLSIGTVTNQTSFVINSSNTLDSSNVYWEIHKPTS